MTTDAGMGLEAVRNWWGRSFCVCRLLALPGAIESFAYQRDLALATLLDAEDERLLQSACRVGQGKESLVRLLRSLSINSCEIELQRVGCAKRHSLCEGCSSAEPGSCQSSHFKSTL